ncbi:MAG TPA: class I SAM-dependent methyltransferase [Vicinamibacterales bacterium]|nr:class I SAM-dependent methyltransferase [Vicinamibacterales bacterium]
MSRDFNPGRPSNRPRRPPREGWEGWDQYAPFYDWENARTLGRRDVKFWTRLARLVRGRVLELGCGTGRVSWPLVKAGVDLVGIDRSEAMLARAAKTTPSVVRVRGDIRALPFADRSFAMAIAPYGVLQSLTRPRDLADALRSVTRVVGPGGMLGIDLVPDVPNWREYKNKIQLRGRSGAAQLTLVESVRQDRRRRVTTFEQCYIERRGRETREHRFELTFRTLSVPTMTRELARAGFRVTAVLGDYDGRSLDARLNERAPGGWGAWSDRNACLILAIKG